MVVVWLIDKSKIQPANDNPMSAVKKEL